MNKKIIDSHIHLDAYSEAERHRLLNSLADYAVQSVITVSNDYHSSIKNLSIARTNERVHVAIGYHPEQTLPSETQLLRLQKLIEQYKEQIVAIGEVGLPYYLRRKDNTVPQEAYVELLELFVKDAKRLNKPIVLHAIYNDAKIAIELLERHNVKNAQFHWFKGDKRTIDRMIANDYYVSFTPDICFEAEIRKIVSHIPLKLIMVETDGPWSFGGPFKGQMTHPKMLHRVIKEIALIKGISLECVYRQIFKNSQRFFKLY